MDNALWLKIIEALNKYGRHGLRINKGLYAFGNSYAPKPSKRFSLERKGFVSDKEGCNKDISSREKVLDGLINAPKIQFHISAHFSNKQMGDGGVAWEEEA